MKIFRVAMFTAVCAVSQAAFADDAPPAGDHPCHKIEESCKAAGFAKGEAKSGKGLFKDCLKPIMEGKAVAGVTADPTEVQACAAAHAKHEHHQPKPAATP